MKKQKGITLITLVITIIILLILAGITIVQLTEEVFGKAKLANQKIRYASAKETVNLKLKEIQVDCIENNEEYNIIKIAKGMEETDDITIEKYYNKEIDTHITDLKGIVVSVDKYSEYKFLIGEECQIIGVLEGDINNGTTMQDFTDIKEFETNILKSESNFNTKITFQPNEYTNKESEKLLVKISNINGIKSIKCPDGDTIVVKNEQEEVGIDYTVSKNGDYPFVVIDNEGKEETLNMKINIFDRVAPNDFTPIEVKNYSKSVILKGNAEDGEETEESAKSGIAKYEYYVNGVKKGETQNENFEITNLVLNTNYTIYLIAYDKVGNWKKSEEINVTPTNILYIYNLEDLKDFRDDVNKGYKYEEDIVNLMADIDLEGKAETPSTWWTPIGGPGANSFCGTFEGNGHKISNMYINGDEGCEIKELGFFMELTKSSCVRNLCIENGFINVDGNFDFVGMLVGYCNGKKMIIENCSVLGGKIIVEEIGGHIGGVAGYASEGRIYRCSNSAFISCNKGMRVGGISGAAGDQAWIEECYNTGNITSIKNGIDHCGGICGEYRTNYYQSRWYKKLLQYRKYYYYRWRRNIISG